MEDDEVGHRRGGCDLRVSLDLYVSDDERRSHDASPSAGEGAEPGLASTLSVGGERAAGARNEEAPAATPAGDCSRSINPAALRSIRELAGVRSGDLARAAGISPPFLSNIEAGRKTPSPTVLHALAQRLGVPIDAITQTT
ncbi:helix-turn-helix domain-containing protein [Brachybacterium paraconglomeratum]|uniref:helix-turn-helix domain-containing protein n=1 Tax=Brachybacterium paraconglomeratum TaxID=173362 RepID=UPI00358DD186